MKTLRFACTLAVGTAISLVGIGACSSTKEPQISIQGKPSAQVVSLSSKARFHPAGASFESAHGGLFAKVNERGELLVTRQGVPHTLSLATESAQREGAGIGLTIAPALSRGGDVERTLGEVVESVELYGEGAEISWRMPSRPKGAGDFVVTQRVQHQGPAERVGSTIRFANEKLRIGDGTFVDAKGKATPVPATLRGDLIEYRVAASVIEESAYPAVLDPIISAEAEVDPTLSPGYATQWNAGFYPLFGYGYNLVYESGVAFDGTNYFVAWVDRRGMDPIIRGALVSASGTLLSSQEIELGGTRDSKNRYLSLAVPRFVRVTAGPGGFLVIWTEVPTAGYFGEMVGRRVSSSGALVDAAPIALGTLPLDDGRALTATSDAFVIAYTTYTSATEQTIQVKLINGATVADPGVRTLESGVKWDQTQNESSVQRLKAAGDLIVYSFRQAIAGNEQRTLYSMRVGASLSAPSTINTGNAHFSLNDMAKGGTKFYLLGNDTNNGEYQLHTLEADGLTLGTSVTFPYYISTVVADANGLLIRDTGNNFCPYTLSLVPSGSCFPALTETSPILSATKLASMSGLLDLPARGSVAALSFFDRGTGAVASKTILPRSANAQNFPVIAFDPESSTYLAAWIDDTAADTEIVPGATDGGVTSGAAGGMRVVGARIHSNANGALQIEPPFAISQLGAQRIAQPRVIWDGGQFLTVWEEDRTIDTALAHRVLAAKVPVASGAIEPVLVTSSTDAPNSSVQPFVVAAAADSTGRTIVWTEGDFEDTRIYAKRWAFADAAPSAGAPLRISSNEKFGRIELSAVFDGKQTLVVWVEGSVLFASHLSAVAFPDGSATPSSTPFVLDSSFSSKESLRISSDGKGQSAVVWASITGSGRREVRAKLIPRDKIVPTEDEAAASISVAPPSEDDSAYPSIAYSNDNESFMVAWSRRRSGGGSGGDWDVVANWVSLDGRVLDSAEGRLISGTTARSVSEAGGAVETGEDEALPEACTGPTATTGLAYVRLDSSAGVRSLRARFRTIVSGRLSGDACNANDDCASRYCVDGVCCHTACDGGCGQCGGENGSEKGQCAPKKAGTLCGLASRYACSGASTACAASCKEGEPNVCAPGLVCRDAQCTPFAASCYDDFHAITETGPVACGGYRCASGVCKGTCESADDCEPGNVCDFKGRCGAPPPLENAPGCSVGGSFTGGWLAIGVVAAGIGATFRRRRAARRSRHSTSS